MGGAKQVNIISFKLVNGLSVYYKERLLSHQKIVIS